MAWHLSAYQTCWCLICWVAFMYFIERKKTASQLIGHLIAGLFLFLHFIGVVCDQFDQIHTVHGRLRQTTPFQSIICASGCLRSNRPLFFFRCTGFLVGVVVVVQFSRFAVFVGAVAPLLLSRCYCLVAYAWFKCYYVLTLYAILNILKRSARNKKKCCYGSKRWDGCGKVKAFQANQRGRLMHFHP